MRAGSDSLKDSAEAQAQAGLTWPSDVSKRRCQERGTGGRGAGALKRTLACVDRAKAASSTRVVSLGSCAGPAAPQVSQTEDAHVLGRTEDTYVKDLKYILKI